jgi:hypothetical protein
MPEIKTSRDIAEAVQEAKEAATLTNAQIGRCGELLVQFKLLKHGIESAPMTTDTGVDIVAYSPKSEQPVTIQVKTNLGPKRAGGKGKMELEWWLPHVSPAQLVALVDLDSQRVWLFTHQEFVEDAHQQKAAKGLHFSFYTDPAARPKRLRCTESDYEDRLIDKRIASVFGPRSDDKAS